MTRDMFASDYPLFIRYYESREPLQMKRLKQLENVIRQGHKSAEGVDKHGNDKFGIHSPTNGLIALAQNTTYEIRRPPMDAAQFIA